MSLYDLFVVSSRGADRRKRILGKDVGINATLELKRTRRAVYCNRLYGFYVLCLGRIFLRAHYAIILNLVFS